MRRRGNASAIDSGLYTPTRSRRGLACSMVGGVYTPPVSKSLAVSFRKPLHPSVCNNACASSPTETITVLLLQTWCSSFRQRGCVSLRNVVTRLLSKRRRRLLTNPPRIAGPTKLASPRPARAATENVGDDFGLSSEPKERMNRARERSHPLIMRALLECLRFHPVCRKCGLSIL